MERTENDNSMPFLFEDIKSSEHPEVILANVPQFKELDIILNMTDGVKPDVFFSHPTALWNRKLNRLRNPVGQS